MCKYAGASKTIAIDVNDYRLDLAKKMGADVCINASREDVAKKIFEETNGRGVDVFLEMSGAQKAYDDGFKTLRPDGRASLLGLAGKHVSIDVNNAIVFKAARVHGINGRKIFQTWHQVRDFVNIGAVDLNKIITHKFKLSEFEQAMAVMKSGNSGKVVLFP